MNPNLISDLQRIEAVVSDMSSYNAFYKDEAHVRMSIALILSAAGSDMKVTDTLGEAVERLPPVIRNALTVTYYLGYQDGRLVGAGDTLLRGIE